MKVTFDTDTRLLSITDRGALKECPLFSPEAFSILSRQWLVLGWNLGHWSTFSWMGRQLLQLPDDVLRLAELFWKLRPDVIIESGVYDGGSTLFFATLCRMQGGGKVISVEESLRPEVAQAINAAAGDIVKLIEGDSTSAATAQMVRPEIINAERVCVFLDSDHSAAHVAAELELWSPFVSPGCYLIVADSICAELAGTPSGEPAWTWDNPAVAVDGFLSVHPEFSRDTPRPLFAKEFDFTHVSYFSNTWLRRAL